MKGEKVTMGKIGGEKKKKKRKKKLLGQRKSRTKILWKLTDSIRKKQEKKETKDRKKDSRVMSWAE